jgi:hypothetical protein
MRVSASPPGNGNGGIVPPWLRQPLPPKPKPPVIVLPVEPSDSAGDSTNRNAEQEARA